MFQIKETYSNEKKPAFNGNPIQKIDEKGIIKRETNMSPKSNKR